MDSTTFHTFLFLDDDFSDIRLRITMTRQTDVVAIASQRDEQSGWTTHTEMRARLHEHEHELAGQSTFETTDAHRSSSHVRKESFYSAIGNNYQGEFRTAQESWVRAGEQIISRIGFEHMNVEPFLRASAWLDACNHTGILMSQLDVNGVSCIAPELIGRPYFAASIESYEVAGQPQCNAPASLSLDAHRTINLPQPYRRYVQQIPCRRVRCGDITSRVARASSTRAVSVWCRSSAAQWAPRTRDGWNRSVCSGTYTVSSGFQSPPSH